MDDILAELTKPGRRPAAAIFEPPQFRDDVRSLEDLKVGMELEGIVTNVTAFGAFVDVGVHQDGLVHVSKLSDKFREGPATVVKVGAKIRVRVLAVDLQLRRISLSARKDDGPQRAGTPQAGARPAGKARPPEAQDRKPKSAFTNNPFTKLRRN